MDYNTSPIHTRSPALQNKLVMFQDKPFCDTAQLKSKDLPSLEWVLKIFPIALFMDPGACGLPVPPSGFGTPSAELILSRGTQFVQLRPFSLLLPTPRQHPRKS